jgi:hypothetical protein
VERRNAVTTYEPGKRIKIRPEWQDAGDDQIEFVVVEDRGERVLIEAQLGMAINPQQAVEKHMIAAA